MANSHRLAYTCGECTKTSHLAKFEVAHGRRVTCQYCGSARMEPTPVVAASLAGARASAKRRGVYIIKRSNRPLPE